MATVRSRLGVVVVLVALAALASLTLTPAVAEKETGDKGKSSLVFEVYKDKGGEYRFRVKDEAGTILAGSGKSYEDKADCLKIIEVLKKGAATAKIDDQSAKK
jgi:uncharacterized protein YegP (UPF0339 family)